MKATMKATFNRRVARPRRLDSIGVCFALALASAAFGQNLQGYWTRNDVTKDTNPCTPGAAWNELPANGEIRLTLARGEKIWFAFCNEEWFGWHKFFLFDIAPFPGSQLYTEEVVGFDEDGNPIKARMHGFGFDASGRDETWRFDEQPEWERIEFTPTIFGLDNERVFVRARSSCTFRWRTAPSDLLFPLEDTSFGAPGAMEGEPKVKKFWIFPWQWFVDLDRAPTFDAPPHTGEWSWEHVFTDPEDRPRPFGGVLWTTDGAGLAAGERFDHELPMVDHLDRRYDLYAENDETGEITRFQYGAPRWNDAFDEYPAGPLAGQGGWEPWNGDPEASGFEVDAGNAHSEPHSLAIDGADDAVRRFAGYTYGVHELTTWMFVPPDMDDVQALILLNTYPAQVAADWSLQLEIDGDAGVIADRNGDARLPLRRGEWTPLRVLIDLDRDTQTVWYDGVRMLDKSWTGGVAEGGAANIAAINLFGGGSAHTVHHDDVLLDDGDGRGACVLEDGTCRDGAHPEFCAAIGGAYLGHEIACAPGCSADLDGDGTVAFGDLLVVLGAWGECAGCPADLDGNGFVGFSDLLIVLGAWGPCPER